MEFLKLNHCKVTDTEGGNILTIDDAFVRVNGDSVSISEYDSKGRAVQRDRIVDVSQSIDTKGVYTFSGRSVVLLPGMALKDDPLISYKVTPGKGCRNCR